MHKIKGNNNVSLGLFGMITKRYIMDYIGPIFRGEKQTQKFFPKRND